MCGLHLIRSKPTSVFQRRQLQLQLQLHTFQQLLRQHMKKSSLRRNLRHLRHQRRQLQLQLQLQTFQQLMLHGQRMITMTAKGTTTRVLLRRKLILLRRKLARRESPASWQELHFTRAILQRQCGLRATKKGRRSDFGGHGNLGTAPLYPNRPKSSDFGMAAPCPNETIWAQRCRANMTIWARRRFGHGGAVIWARRRRSQIVIWARRRRAQMTI